MTCTRAVRVLLISLAIALGLQGEPASADGQPCDADIVVDGSIDGLDLGALLAAWGQSESPANLERSELSPLVDGLDLGLMLAAWGRCFDEIVIPDAVLSGIYHSQNYVRPTRLVYPNLTSVTGNVGFHQCNNLVQVSMPLLTSTQGHLYVNGNQQLERFLVPALTSVRQYAYVVGNTSLELFQACALQDVFCDGNGEPYTYVANNNPAANICFGTITLHGTTLTTAPVTSFSHNSAVAGGTFTRRCSSSVTAGVCWSTSPNPTVNDSKAETFSGSDSFSLVMGGLTPATTYYVRAFSGSGSPVYGNQVSFTTLP